MCLYDPQQLDRHVAVFLFAKYMANPLHAPGCAVRVRTSTAEASSGLFVRYAPEGQVDARQGDGQLGCLPHPRAAGPRPDRT